MATLREQGRIRAIKNLVEDLENHDVDTVLCFRILAQAVLEARFKDRFDEIVEEAVTAIDEAQEEREQGDPVGDAMDRGHQERVDKEMNQGREG